MGSTAETSFNKATVAFAVLLSLCCLLRGGVYDTTIAVLLIATLPILYFAFESGRPVHGALLQHAKALLLLLVVILVLQQLGALFASEGTIGQDKAALMQSFGRLLWFMMVFTIALFIGSNEEASRLFFQWLRLSGMVCLAFTFFLTTSDGLPSSTQYSYSHGFINPNNASAYLGIMLLLTLMHIVEYFKRPTKTLRKMFVEFIDKLNIKVITKGCALLFMLLLLLAGLFMTGSRAGVILSLLCGIGLVGMILLKMNARTRTRQRVMLAVMVLVMALTSWSFFNFGDVVTDKIKSDGISSNSRTDIFAAVIPMILQRPILGGGLGSFPGDFQRYRPATISADGVIDKAHNSYLEFAAEMGIPALIGLLMVLGWAAYTLYRGYTQRTEHYLFPALGFCVMAFVGLFSLVDFPLQIPGIAALSIAIVTICVSQTERKFSMSTLDNKPLKRVRIRKRRVKVLD